MKKLLVVAAALTVAAPAAMASKARVQALNNSRQIVDIQSAFDRPYQFMALPEMVTIEWGQSGDGKVTPADNTATPPETEGSIEATSRGEAGFLKRHGDDAVYGAYLGRRSAEFTDVVNNVRVSDPLGNGTAPFSDLLLEQNPLNVFYAAKTGDWTWGVTLKYSNGKSDTNDRKASSSGIAIGAAMGQFEAELTQGFAAQTESATAGKIESKGLTKVGVGYKIDENMEVYGNYGMIKVDATPAGGTSATLLDAKSFAVGFVNTFAKTEDTSLFYGVAYTNKKIDQGDETSALPVWIGMEASLNSWLVARGSVSQNLFINEVKANNGDKDDLDSLAFNAGLGVKMGKGILDATVTSARTGTLGFQDDLLSQVSFTYMF